MLVLVWQNYGSINVYELDGAVKEEKVKEKLLEVAAYNEMSEGLTDLMSIGFIVKKLKEQSDDVDAFEYLEIMTLDEAIKYAKRLMENNLWVFKDAEDAYHVIRLLDGDSTYKHYCNI